MLGVKGNGERKIVEHYTGHQMGQPRGLLLRMTELVNMLLSLLFCLGGDSL